MHPAQLDAGQKESIMAASPRRVIRASHTENAATPAGNRRSPQDIIKVDEPQLKAMFETAAEILGGLKRHSAITSRKNEPAWKGRG